MNSLRLISNLKRRAAAPLVLVLAALLPWGALSGCSSEADPPAPKAPAKITEDRRQALKSQLAEMQLRLTELENRITDLQTQQKRALEDLATASEQINKDFVGLKSEALALASGELATAAAPPPAVDTRLLEPSNPAAMAPETSAAHAAPAKASDPSPFLRLFLWVIVILAIGFFVRLFIARKDEEFDDYEPGEAAPDVKLNEYGTIEMPGGAPRDPVQAAHDDDDIEHTDRR
jgi:hypothetical protein